MASRLLILLVSSIHVNTVALQALTLNIKLDAYNLKVYSLHFSSKKISQRGKCSHGKNKL